MLTMNNFKVITASAGAGKTFTLVLYYLKLVINNPDLFANILSITFTNKAANEMKDRIVNQLYLLSIGEGDKTMREELERCITEGTVDEKAAKCLNKILHNYSSFAVSTIDSFSQRLIRTFYHDMQLSYNYKVELNFNEIISDAVNNLLEKAGTDDTLTDFLSQYINERIDNNKNINFDEPLLKIANLLSNESIRTTLLRNNFSELSLTEIFNVIKAKQEEIRKSKKTIKDIAQHAIGLIEGNGININDFPYKERGIGNFFVKASENQHNIKVNSHHKSAIYDDKWYSKQTDMQTQRAIDSIKEDLKKDFDSIIKANDKLKDILIETANIYPLALLNEINKEIETIKKEKNILPISEFNSLINNIIIQSDTPFIYERLGDKYHHYLIDEFQDTSVLQWQNIIPLIDNSLSMGHMNLIVGDAKQAIYRWRNGEVKQFIELPKIYNVDSDNGIWESREQSLKDNYDAINLEFNFRSGKEIVNFNNKLYRDIIFHDENLQQFNKGIFDKATQKTTKKFDGYVEVIFTEKESKELETNENILKIINELTKDLSYGFNDIAILCEKKKQAYNIAQFLTDNGIEIVSPDSMLLKSSEEVQLLVSVIKLITGECDDSDMLYFIDYMSSNKLFPQPSYVIINQINKARKDKFQNKPQYFDELKQICAENNFSVDWDKIIYSSPIEVFENIITALNSPKFDNAFVNQLLNYVYNIKESLWEFPQWFSKNINNLCISAFENPNAVQIMTIHKSKGLEFPVTICPYVNYNVTPIKGEMILLKNKNYNYNGSNNDDLPFYFVNFSSKLEDSKRFKQEYNDEIQQRILDKINLMYVATTRATEHLYIISDSGDQSSKTFNVNKYITKIVEQNGCNTFGTKTKKLQQKQQDNTNDKHVISSKRGNWRNNFKIASRISKTATQSDVNDFENEEIVWGNQLHELMSYIKRENDIDFALKKIKSKYSFDDENFNKIKSTLHNIIDNKEVNKLLFDYEKVYLEREFISGEGNRLRVDRMMRKDDKYLIVDFKTGIEDDEHIRQVNKYCKIISEITKKEAIGYLIYCNEQNSKLKCVSSTLQIGI